MVQTPFEKEIYWDRKFDPETGGSLDVDFRPGEEGQAEFGTWTENINFPSGAPFGAFIVWVNQFNQKGEFADEFTLEIFDDINSPSVAIYSFSFGGLDQGESTSCYTYNKPSGTISVSPDACVVFVPPDPVP